MSDSMTADEAKTGRPLAETVTLSWEKIAWLVLLLSALTLRVYQLGVRVMSHDESLHTYYSWKLFDHGEYVHDPMMHGPLLFHGTALMYYIFGDNDFAARMFSVILGMFLVASPLLLRRWLGPVGALAAGAMLTVSPTILYYTRYLRHDIHVELFTVLMFASLIRFLSDRRGRWIVLSFAAAALAISSAEMAYINGFVLVIFIITALLAERLSERMASNIGLGLAGLGAGLLIFSSLAKLGFLNNWFASMPDFNAAAAEGQLLAWPELIQASLLFGGILMIYGTVMAALAALRLPFEDDAAVIALSDDDAEDGEAVSLKRPSTLGDLLFGPKSLYLGLLGLILLGVGGAIYGSSACATEMPAANIILGLEACRLSAGLLASGAVIFVYGLLGYLLDGYRTRGFAGAIGRAPSESIILAAVVAFAIYALLYTTFFTNTPGFNGLVRSISYWLEQHEVVRGDQPWYYYGLFNPMYEFLPFSFALAAGWVYARRPALRVWRGSGSELGGPPSVASAYFLPGLLAWAAGVFWIYSWAGEKMPWLITHMVVPQIFIAARLISDAVEFLDWEALRERVWWLAGLFLLFFIALAVQVARLLYADGGWDVAAGLLTLGLLAWLAWRLYALVRDDRAREAALLGGGVLIVLLIGQIAGGFALGLVGNIGDMFTALAGATPTGWAQGLLGLALLGIIGYGIYHQGRAVPALQLGLLDALVLAGLLFVVNTRYSMVANFVNDELATEYIVYAHATDEGNTVLDRLELLQERVGDRDLSVGYDNEVSWPFTWYFRNTQWPGAVYMGEKPSGQAQLRERDVVLVGSPNYGNFEDYLVRDFNAYEYDRMWWPNEGYKGLGLDAASYQRLRDLFNTDELRRNLLDIVIKRQYRQDASLPATADNLKSLDSWYHHAKMKMWVRKDLDDQAGQTSDLGEAPPEPTSIVEQTDPLDLDVELRFERDAEGGGMLAPKGIAVDDAGTLYVVDHDNARVLVFDADGQPLEPIASGELRDASGGPSAWGIGVAPDGSAVYIADTWNHRVMKFVDGEMVSQWGVFNTPPTPGESFEMMYGPRDIAVDGQGNVYVADTGNKRVTIFDAEGKGIGFLGGAGLEVGQMDEPTSVAIDRVTGNIYVADLWNYRVQVFDADRRPIRQWPVEGWESLDAQHKAYIDVHPDGYVIFSDPEKSRVWLYDSAGTPLGLMSLPMDDYGMDLPIGVAFDSEGRVYVAASGSHVVTRYAKPAAMEDGADGEAEAEDDAASEADAAGDEGGVEAVEEGDAGDGGNDAGTSDTSDASDGPADALPTPSETASGEGSDNSAPDGDGG